MIKTYHIESCFDEMIEDISYLKFVSMFGKINEYRKSKQRRRVK